jgi:uncharacterized membrane protein YcaP (DUF421 family)
MIESLGDFFNWLLGLDADDLAMWQMGARAGVVYVAGIALVRMGAKRFIGKFAAFDVIIGIMLGSILSGAITGSTPFIPSLVAAGVLVLMHSLSSRIAFHSDRFGDLIKGHPRVLIRDGEIQMDAMNSGQISMADLREGLRTSANIEDPAQVHLAYLERSGDVSVVEDKSDAAPVKDEQGT